MWPFSPGNFFVGAFIFPAGSFTAGIFFPPPFTGVFWSGFEIFGFVEVEEMTCVRFASSFFSIVAIESIDKKEI